MDEISKGFFLSAHGADSMSFIIFSRCFLHLSLRRLQKFHQFRFTVRTLGIPFMSAPFRTAVTGMFRRFRPAHQMQVRCCKIPFSCCRIFLCNQLGSVIELIPVIPDSDVFVLIPQSPGLVISQPFLPLVIVFHRWQLWLFLWLLLLPSFLLRQKPKGRRQNLRFLHGQGPFLFWRILEGFLHCRQFFFIFFQ